MSEKGIESLLSVELRRHVINPVSIRVTADNRIGTYGDSPAGGDRKLERVALFQLARYGL